MTNGLSMQGARMCHRQQAAIRQTDNGAEKYVAICGIPCARVIFRLKSIRVICVVFSWPAVQFRRRHEIVDRRKAELRHDCNALQAWLPM